MLLTIFLAVFFGISFIVNIELVSFIREKKWEHIHNERNDDTYRAD